MTTPDEPDLTAAELALGVLEGEERAAALRRRLSDPAFAREIERWRELLGGFFVEWPAMEPPPAAERRIMAVTSARPSGERRWKSAAAISSAAAVLLLAVLVEQQINRSPVPLKQAVPAPSLVAVVKPADSDPVAIAVDPTTRIVRVGGRVATPADRVAELWVIGRDGVPHAAGLLAGPRPLAIPGDLALRPGGTLAISIEPVGGSPKPTPTGPVVATGALVAI